MTRQDIERKIASHKYVERDTSVPPTKQEQFDQLVKDGRLEDAALLAALSLSGFNPRPVKTVKEKSQ